MPTILAGALKRMPGLPANVVAGVPRVEKDPRGGDVVIVLVRPYARDMDRCARCGERGRPYDRCVLSSCYRPVWREFSFRKSGRF
ncbi:transposase [Bifidobacterium breve]|nr:transposase [Bifidobacterium breve]